MAKGNLFLGTAARSVGDVVMYRREGAQVSRVRVRKIANPKTDAQCLQRAFMSACVKFYQPLANVLDRSWQGKSRAKSYNAFLKANATKVRAAGYFITKGTGFFPLPLQVSNGTIAPVPVDSVNQALLIKVNGLTGEETPIATIGELSTLLVANGYQNGDIVTIIISEGLNTHVYNPVSLQFEIDTTSEQDLTTAFPGYNFIKDPAQGGHLVVATNNADICAGTVIVARNVDGVWQRSKQTMIVDATVLATVTSDAAKTACIDSYKGAAASDNPLVYLDGDELTD